MTAAITPDSSAPAPTDSPLTRWNRAGELPRLGSEIRELVQYRDLLRSLVHRDLTVRYKRSPIGFLWTMLHPLILMVIFVIIFSTLFKFNVPNYAIYFLAPYIAWNFFNQTVIDTMASVKWNGALMKRVRVPRSIFVVASTTSAMVNLALSIVPLLGIMLITGARIRWTVVFLPVAFLILGAFTLGAALAFSALSIYFVDVREMYQAASPALMYLTPIIYPLSIVPERYLWLIKLNPLVYLVQLFRAPIYYGIIPTGMTVLVAALAAAASLTVGWSIFRHLAPGFHAHV